MKNIAHGKTGTKGLVVSKINCPREINHGNKNIAVAQRYPQLAERWFHDDDPTLEISFSVSLCRHCRAVLLSPGPHPKSFPSSTSDRLYRTPSSRQGITCVHLSLSLSVCLSLSLSLSVSLSVSLSLSLVPPSPVQSDRAAGREAAGDESHAP